MDHAEVEREEDEHRQSANDSQDPEGRINGSNAPHGCRHDRRRPDRQARDPHSPDDITCLPSEQRRYDHGPGEGEQVDKMPLPDV
jgi:hypothetical protein